MSAVTVEVIPPEHRPTPEDELIITTGVSPHYETLVISRADAKKLRDALCIMVGMPGKKK